METNKLQIASTQLQNTQINKEIVSALFHVNRLTSFPIQDIQLEFWAKDIQKLNPELTAEIIGLILNNMKKGRILFDSRLGIQNIYSGYKVYLAEKLKNLYKQRQTHLSKEDETIISDDIKTTEKILKDISPSKDDMIF